MAAHVASVVPTATQVLGVTVEQTSVLEQSVAPAATHATQAPATPPAAALHLGRAAEMAAQLSSVVPAATQVLGVTVEIVGVAEVVAAVHETQALVAHLGRAAEMAPQVASLSPTATQVLAVTVEHAGVPPEQSEGDAQSYVV